MASPSTKAAQLALLGSRLGQRQGGAGWQPASLPSSGEAVLGRERRHDKLQHCSPGMNDADENCQPAEILV